MLAATWPGSSLTSFRTSPVSHDTSRANSTFVRPPSGAPGTVSVLMHRASLPLFCVCAADSRSQTPLGVRWGCHIPCPDTDAEVDLRLDEDALPPRTSESPPTAWYRGHWLRPPRCSVAHRWPLRGYCAWSPACRGRSGCGQLHPPQTSFTHRRICRLPLPVHSSQLITASLDDGPDPGEYPSGLPPLKRAMDGAVITKVFRQPVPLVSEAHTKDDSVEHLAGGMPLAPGGLAADRVL